nr:unnamed protein product [Callosobruchus analis]
MKVDGQLAVLSDIRNYSSKRVVWDRHVQRPISVY